MRNAALAVAFAGAIVVIAVAACAPAASSSDAGFGDVDAGVNDAGVFTGDPGWLRVLTGNVGALTTTANGTPVFLEDTDIVALADNGSDRWRTSLAAAGDKPFTLFFNTGTTHAGALTWFGVELISGDGSDVHFDFGGGLTRTVASADSLLVAVDDDGAVRAMTSLPGGQESALAGDANGALWSFSYNGRFGSLLLRRHDSNGLVVSTHEVNGGTDSIRTRSLTALANGGAVAFLNGVSRAPSVTLADGSERTLAIALGHSSCGVALVFDARGGVTAALALVGTESTLGRNGVFAAATETSDGIVLAGLANRATLVDALSGRRLADFSRALEDTPIAFTRKRDGTIANIIVDARDVGAFTDDVVDDSGVLWMSIERFSDDAGPVLVQASSPQLLVSAPLFDGVHAFTNGFLVDDDAVLAAANVPAQSTTALVGAPSTNVGGEIGGRVDVVMRIPRARLGL